MYYTRCRTSLCDMILVGDENGLKRVHMIVEDSNRELKIDDEWIENAAIFKDAILQLQQYANGELETFDLKLNPDGTEFQKQVWHELSKIPYGETYSYKDIAILVGNEKASRAVGMANGKNPIPVIIPCHRVIGSNGKLTGFAFGTKIKEKMIEMEKQNG